MSPRTRSWPSSGKPRPGSGRVVLDIGATADLDVATTDMLAALFTELEQDGIDLRLAQVRGSVRDRMRRTGLVDLIGEERWFLSNAAAVAAPFVDRVAATDEPPDATTDEVSPPVS